VGLEWFGGYMVAMGYKAGWLCICEYCGSGWFSVAGV